MDRHNNIIRSLHSVWSHILAGACVCDVKNQYKRSVSNGDSYLSDTNTTLKTKQKQAFLLENISAQIPRHNALEHGGSMLGKPINRAHKALY